MTESGKGFSILLSNASGTSSQPLKSASACSRVSRVALATPSIWVIVAMMASASVLDTSPSSSTVIDSPRSKLAVTCSSVMTPKPKTAGRLTTAPMTRLVNRVDPQCLRNRASVSCRAKRWCQRQMFRRVTQAEVVAATRPLVMVSGSHVAAILQRKNAMLHA